MTSRKSEAAVVVENDLEKALLLSDKADHDNKKSQQQQQQQNQFVLPCTSCFSCNGKKIVTLLLALILGLLFWDSLVRPPEERFLTQETLSSFLIWVEANPYWGIGAFLLVIAVCVVLLIPIGTPLTLGCGYIYKGVYGWTVGVAVATAVSIAGSALGAVICFLLGRYLMRNRVRKWVRKYPLFDAIDMAVSEHGLRIMAMLYLTPVLPLGPVSYMCGSTSMALSSFVLAKIASLPLMLLYVYIGAAAGTLMVDTDAIEHNSALIGSGILLSGCMILGITHYIRKELMVILERQKSKTSSSGNNNNTFESAASEPTSSLVTSNILTAGEKTLINSGSNLELNAMSPTTPLQRRHVVGFLQHDNPSVIADDDIDNTPQKDR